jgi:glutathione synthase/RimK-type ligase-like ATP-grasp enzyme
MNVISENIPNIRCLAMACDQLNIPYQYYDKNHNFIAITLDQIYYFANASTPLNSHSIAKICKDKQFTYQVIQDVVRMPRTSGFLNPDCDPKFHKYLTHFSIEEITKAITESFLLPVIIKKNAGSQGVNVFLCNTPQEIHLSLTKIYDKNSYLFDYIALAQQHVNIAHEFRVIIYNKQILLTYEKDISQALFVGNLSPLHFENSKAVLLTDQVMIKRLQDFIQPIFSKIAINFAGLDIVLDKDNNMWLLELNSSPGFEHFVKDNSDEPLISMYQKILLDLKSGI